MVVAVVAALALASEEVEAVVRYHCNTLIHKLERTMESRIVHKHKGRSVDHQRILQSSVSSLVQQYAAVMIRFLESCLDDSQVLRVYNN